MPGAALLCTGVNAAQASVVGAGGNGQAVVISGFTPLDKMPAAVEISALELWQTASESGGTPATDAGSVLSGRAGEFVPLAAQLLGSSRWGSVSWLRVTLRATAGLSAEAASVRSVLALPRSYLDDVTLFSPVPPFAGQPERPNPTSPQRWYQQEAGDTIVPSRWAVAGLYPRFMLPSALQLQDSGGALQLYLRVVHNAPFETELSVLSAGESAGRTQMHTLALGLMLGALLCVSALLGALAWHAKDLIYAWFSAYAVLTALACASHAGLAHRVLWPVGGNWPGFAVLVFLMLAAACQLQFSRLALVSQQGLVRPTMKRATHSLSLACLALAAAYMAFPARWQATYVVSLFVLGLSAAVVTWWVVAALRQRNRLALVWLLAYLPLFGVVVVALLEGVGMLGSRSVGIHTPIYAAGASVIVLGAALQWFSRERQNSRALSKALAATDPLTGCFTAAEFQRRLKQVWGARHGDTGDWTVAYVALLNPALDAGEQAQVTSRVVRALRSATGSQDTVARLDGSMFALLMPVRPGGQGVRQLLARIVAIGLMPDPSEPRAQPLHFRISHASCKRYAGDLAALQADLREAIGTDRNANDRPVRSVDRASVSWLAASHLRSDPAAVFPSESGQPHPASPPKQI